MKYISWGNVSNTLPVYEPKYVIYNTNALSLLYIEDVYLGVPFSYGSNLPPVKDAESKCRNWAVYFEFGLFIRLSPFKNIMPFLTFARYSIHWFGVHLQHDNLSRWRRHDSNVRTRRDLIYSQALLTAQPLLRLTYITIIIVIIDANLS